MTPPFARYFFAKVENRRGLYIIWRRPRDPLLLSVLVDLPPAELSHLLDNWYARFRRNNSGPSPIQPKWKPAGRRFATASLSYYWWGFRRHLCTTKNPYGRFSMIASWRKYRAKSFLHTWNVAWKFWSTSGTCLETTKACRLQNHHSLQGKALAKSLPMRISFWKFRILRSTLEILLHIRDLLGMSKYYSLQACLSSVKPDWNDDANQINSVCEAWRQGISAKALPRIKHYLGGIYLRLYPQPFIGWNISPGRTVSKPNTGT